MLLVDGSLTHRASLAIPDSQQTRGMSGDPWSGIRIGHHKCDAAQTQPLET